jgi:hypothetical protein
VDLPLLMPMFDDRVRILGLDVQGLTLGLAATGLLLGLVWARRIARVEVYRSFRATDRPRELPLTLVTGLLAVGFLGLALVTALNA